MSYDKARGLSGKDLAPFEAKLDVRDGGAQWSIKDIEDRTIESVAELKNAGLSIRDIAIDLDTSKSSAHRHVKKAEALGLIVK